MENKKGFSILKVVITIIAIIFIVASLAVNIIFSGGKIPHLFGRYIYIASESPEINAVTPGSALIAKESVDIDIVKGDIVLCYPSGSSTLQLRSIYNIETDPDTNELKYYTATSDNQGTEMSIGKNRIAAVCTGYPESPELGRYITFTLNIKGIVCQLIIPCIVLVIFLIAKIASSRDSGAEDDEYGFYEYDDEDENIGYVPSHERQNGPLFEPSQEIQPSTEFERKKMSIAEHFSQKQVNPNSPYQKEKERTMQFKALRENHPGDPHYYGSAPQYSPQHSAESSFAARNMGGQYAAAPTADALREEMLRKTAEAESNGVYNTKAFGAIRPAGRYASSVSDNTGVIPKAQLEKMTNPDIAPAPSYPRPSTRTVPPVTPVRKSSSPDIGDIIAKSEENAKKRSADKMSVDDLLQMIENEKRKL